MQVPYQDLSAVNDVVLDDFLAELKTVIEDGQVASAAHVQKFEEIYARFIGNKFCMGVGSGPDSILLSLRALGIGPGDEVIVPAFGSISPAESVARVGATPVFVDVRPETYTMDPDKTLATITSRTRAMRFAVLEREDIALLDDARVNHDRASNRLVLVPALAASQHGRQVDDQGC